MSGQQTGEDLRIRVVLAFIALIIAKVITVITPIIYKAVVDQMTGLGGDPSGSCFDECILIATPIMLILAYGMARIMMIIFNQIRDVSVRQCRPARGALACPTAPSPTLTNCPLRYHLERQTGGHARAIERGVSAGRADCPHGFAQHHSNLCRVRADCRCFVLVYRPGNSLAVVAADESFFMSGSPSRPASGALVLSAN